MVEENVDGLSILEELWMIKRRQMLAGAFLTVKGNTKLWRFRITEVIKTLHLFRHRYLLLRLKETYDAFKNPVAAGTLQFLVFLEHFAQAKDRRALNRAFSLLRQQAQAHFGPSELLFFLKVCEGLFTARRRDALLALRRRDRLRARLRRWAEGMLAMVQGRARAGFEGLRAVRKRGIRACEI